MNRNLDKEIKIARKFISEKDIDDCLNMDNSVEFDVGYYEGLNRAKKIQENKYKDAFEYLSEYWESFDKEQQKEINKNLNKIFGKDHPEYVEDIGRLYNGFRPMKSVTRNKEA